MSHNSRKPPDRRRCEGRTSFTVDAAAVSFGQAPAASAGGPITVLEFRWNRDRKSRRLRNPPVIPARAVIAANKKFEREARANLPPGAIDPNTMTVDGRSEALEKITRNRGRKSCRRSKALTIRQS